VTRLVGINHVALEVGDVEEALAFYSQLFEFTLRGRSQSAAFIDIGDQFIALMEGRSGPPDRARHFGLVVDDKEATRRALESADVAIRPGRGLDFNDPWGNYVQVVQYDEVQFTKADRVLQGMGLDLGKSERALAELQSKGLARASARAFRIACSAEIRSAPSSSSKTCP
jgi:lactoylglutathione lyase